VQQREATAARWRSPRVLQGACRPCGVLRRSIICGSKPAPPSVAGCGSRQGQAVGESAAYAELGLAPGASEAELKVAWRRLVSHWHPDRHPDPAALARMQRINQAYRLLRRAGARPAGAAGGSGPADAAPAAAGCEPAQEAADGAADGAASDSAADSTTDSARSPRPTVRRRVTLSLEEALTGCTRVLKGRWQPVCGPCGGAGLLGPLQACGDCEGGGRQRQRLWYGWRATGEPCGGCTGTGRVQPPCTACGGSGKGLAQAWRVQVRLPPGVRDGDALLVRAARAGPATRLPVDLELRVQWLPHPLFTLHADDGLLHLALPVDGLAWVAERTLPVPTPDGLQPLALRREQRSYRLPGHGLALQRGGARGDLVVDIEPVWPQRFSADQQILLDQLLASAIGADGRPREPRLADWQGRLQAWQRTAGRGGA
jgi:molecular chaperone DnaJ